MKRLKSRNVLAFDHATYRFLDLVGIGQDYLRRTSATMFILESHVTFQRELVAGDPLRVATQIMGVDRKRLHYFHTMYHGEQGYLVATNELMAIHVDTASRRSRAIPEEALIRLRDIEARHRRLPRSAEVGRVIGLGATRIG